MFASCDVPERPVPATKIGEGADMAFSQAPAPRPAPHATRYSVVGPYYYGGRVHTPEPRGASARTGRRPPSSRSCSPGTGAGCRTPTRC
ncbi:hypothetical protein FGK60_13995 [Streptomyces sp. DASNCL29]|nr:hypothetical protein FGK60_13995 [Streptomyces sp. DASNCL29]